MGYWYLISIISGFCLGLRMVTDDYKVGHPLRAYAEQKLLSGKLSKYIADPLILCCACMASLYGTIIYWTIQFYFGFHITAATFGFWILICFTCSFINGFVWSLFEIIKKL